MSGRLMLTAEHKKGEALSFNTSSLPAGIYLCKVQGEATQYAKVVIAK